MKKINSCFNCELVFVIFISPTMQRQRHDRLQGPWSVQRVQLLTLLHTLLLTISAVGSESIYENGKVFLILSKIKPSIHKHDSTILTTGDAMEESIMHPTIPVPSYVERSGFFNKYEGKSMKYLA